MSHLISIGAASSGTYVVDLRRTDQSGTAPTGDYYKACKLRISSVQDGASKSTAVVAPIVVADGASPPAASAIALSTTAKAMTWLDSTLHPTVEIGQSYGPGYSAGVFKEIVATHVMINCSAAGVVEIVVD